MARRAVRSLALVCESVNLGLGLSHVLAMGPKRRMAGPDFLVAQRLYAGYGRVAAVTVPGAAASAGVSALVADTRRVRSLCVFAGLAIAATVAIWRFANEPVNREVVTWRADALPADWEQRRDQWEFAHATSAGLHAVAICALLAAAQSRPRR